MSNKALIYLFDKIYNNGNLTDLLISKKTITNLSNHYKNHFQSSTNYEEFYSKLGDLKTELEKSSAAAAEYRKQFKKNMALQSAILTECFMSQTLANILNLESFLDIKEGDEKIPNEVFELILKFKEGKLEHTTPRYIYYSKNSSAALLQYGDSSSIDAIFIKDNYRVRLEFKEEKSKLGEYDLDYDEFGKLIPTNNIINNHSQYLEIIDAFNKETTVFDQLCKNFKIGKFLDNNLAFKIFENVFNLKKIDLYVFQNKNKIFSVPSAKLIDFVDFDKGSEIRNTGKNTYNIFTPNYFNNLIANNGGKIVNGNISLPYDHSKKLVGKGRKDFTKYKISNLFIVKLKDVKIENNIINFSIKKVKQIKCTISLHLYVKLNRNNFDELLKFLS